MLRSGAVILLMLLAGLPAPCQSDTWETVQALPAGAMIKISLQGNKTVTGTLDQASSEGLTLTRKHESIQVAKSDVSLIWVLRKGSRLKRAGIAAAVGFALGCPLGIKSVGLFADASKSSTEGKAGYCLALGGLTGGMAAGIVAAMPTTRRTLVYLAPPTNKSHEQATP